MKSEETKVLERIERILLRIADKLGVEQAKTKSESAGAVAIVRSPGKPMIVDDGDVPSAITDDMREALRPGTPSTREPVPGRSGVMR